MKLATIVVGVDFSPRGAHALAQAEALAAMQDGELVLVHASGIDEAGTYVYEVAGRADEPWKTYVHDKLEKGRERLEALATEVKQRGRRVRALHVDGFAETALAATTAQVEADVLVVGTHGHTGVDRWLLGSVAERVTRLSERNVLVARPPVVTSFDHILVGSDFSPASELALDAAMTVAAPGARIDVVHCYHPPFVGADAATPWLEDRLRAWAEEQGDELRAKLDETSEASSMGVEIVAGTPVATLLARLEAGGHDAVFLGSHGKRGLRRMLLGSVTEQTLRYAHRPVFVAHLSA